MKKLKLSNVIKMTFCVTGDILIYQNSDDLACYDLSTALGFDYRFSKRIVIKYPDGHNVTIECEDKELIEPVTSYFIARAHKKFLQNCATRYSFVLMYIMEVGGDNVSTVIEFSKIKLVKTNGENTITIVDINDVNTDYLQRSGAEAEMQMKIITEALQRTQSAASIELKI